MKKSPGFLVPSVLATLAFSWPSESEGQGTSRAPAQAPANRGAEAPSGQSPTSAEVVLRALLANPLTAPYSFSAEVRGRQVVLHGRVGTKQIHDAAIQTAIALGVPVVDALVIDTAAAHQVAAMAAGGYGAGGGYGGSPFAGSGLGGSLPYTYPPPLFGRLDDPFFGFEPPYASFPPWWNALSAQRLGNQAAPVGLGGNGGNGAVAGQGGAAGPMATTPSDPADPGAVTSIPDGTIDMVIDAKGTATLRGVVPTLTDRVAIGQQVARTPGITQVVNLLSVRPMAQVQQGQAPARALSDTPPPPPTPYEPPARANLPGASLDGPPIAPDGDPVAGRISRTIAANPSLAGRAIKVKVRDGVASISGTVPSVYEAMLAYRAAQQAPGVREVDDRLEFVVPDGSGRNPLSEKGRPEDVEPYLEAQIRRQVGGLAHIDRVRVQGDSVDVRGTLERAGDRPRFDAILRSMPLLRGFKLAAEMAESSP